jgi:hypothetical protein
MAQSSVRLRLGAVALGLCGLPFHRMPNPCGGAETHGVPYAPSGLCELKTVLKAR